MADNNETASAHVEDSFEDIDLDSMSESLAADLENAFEKVELLKEDRDKIGNPDALAKVIGDEVLKQFSNQLGFSLTDESLVEKYDREHPETFAESKVGNKARSDKRYKDVNASNKIAQENGTLKDAYTGKKLKQSDNQNLDHVVPIKEIFGDAKRKQANADVVDLANLKDNLAATNESLNKAKRDTSNKEFVANRTANEDKWEKSHDKVINKIDKSNASDADKNSQKRTQDKRYNDKKAADDKLMLEADEKARKAINDKIKHDRYENIGKKAGLDALKQMAIQGLMDLLKRIMGGLVKFFKSKEKSFKVFLADMKEAIKGFLSNILSLVQTGASSFLGTILNEIFGPIIGIFKKMASFIKQGISSVIDAIKYLANPDNKNKPFSEKVAQVGKILIAAITGGAAITLGGVFEGALMNVPIFAFEIPLIGTLANVVGVFLSSLLSGVIGAILINLIDKWIAKRQQNEIDTEIVVNQNQVLKTQNKQSAVEQALTDRTKSESMIQIANRHAKANEQIRNIISDMAADTIDHDSRRSVNSVHDDEFEKMNSALDELL
ncbi:AI-2E family transporter [Weissella confusa]|uniref:AI-2E family transporter n=1 Tax=Weissella confusa TaxID=1583 RepID=UPI0022FE697C|nr:hypothetical protein [Weissella confusa]MDA5457422.1 hypothetical protein [Weissella confusa]